MDSSTSDHGQDDNSRRLLRSSRLPDSTPDSSVPWWQPPNGIIREPPQQPPSRSWYLTSGLAYTHDRANFRSYRPLTTSLTLSSTSTVAPPGPEIKIHGIGSVTFRARKPLGRGSSVYVITLNNVLHWKEAPCNGFNPQLEGNEGLGNSFEVSPTYAKGWEDNEGLKGSRKLWAARREYENGGIRLLLSGRGAVADGLPRWMVRDVYVSKQDKKRLGIVVNVPRSLEPQGVLNYNLAAEQLGGSVLADNWDGEAGGDGWAKKDTGWTPETWSPSSHINQRGDLGINDGGRTKETYFIDGREVVVDWGSEPMKKMTRTRKRTVVIDGEEIELSSDDSPTQTRSLTKVVKETVIIDGKEIDVTWDDSPSESSMATGANAMMDAFELEGEEYEIDIIQ